MKSALLAFAVLSALGACVDDTAPEEIADEALDRRKPKPSPTPTPPPGGTFTCYSTTDPGATCSAPQQCCFDGTASHSGACGSSCSSWGTLACDGPEDCSNGQRCCATMTGAGVTVGCADTCLPYFQGGDELCHEPSVCDGGRWCITAYGTQPALPRTVAICR
jgi:hypothetical protein